MSNSFPEFDIRDIVLRCGLRGRHVKERPSDVGEGYDGDHVLRQLNTLQSIVRHLRTFEDVAGKPSGLLRLTPRNSPCGEHDQFRFKWHANSEQPQSWEAHTARQSNPSNRVQRGTVQP